MLTSAKLRGPRHQKVYFMKLHMGVHLRAKFEVSSIILTSFRQGGVILHPPTSKRTSKKPTQIRVDKTTICCSNMSYFNVFGFNKRKIFSIVTKFAQCKILKILMISYVERSRDYRLTVIIGSSSSACF